MGTQPASEHSDRWRKVGQALARGCNILSVPVLAWGVVYMLLDDSGYMGSVLKAFAGLVTVLPTSGICLVPGVSALVLTRVRTLQGKIVVAMSLLHPLLMIWTAVYIVRNG